MGKDSRALKKPPSLGVASVHGGVRRASGEFRPSSATLPIAHARVRRSVTAAGRMQRPTAVCRPPNNSWLPLRHISSLGLPAAVLCKRQRAYKAAPAGCNACAGAPPQRSSTRSAHPALTIAYLGAQ